MWIAMNKSFVSIVQHRDDTNSVVVRARVKEDLIDLFPQQTIDIIETDDSDYRFRLSLDKELVADVVRQRVVGINYPNFKNSVKESWRKQAYMKIWNVMYDVQAQKYKSAKNWWASYR